jgi:hypothetical protein
MRIITLLFIITTLYLSIALIEARTELFKIHHAQEIAALESGRALR